jgi:hypothetical protein
MTVIDKENIKFNASKTAYSKPSIVELSTDAGTQGMGMNVFGGTKMTVAAESFVTMSPS